MSMSVSNIIAFGIDYSILSFLSYSHGQSLTDKIHDDLMVKLWEIFDEKCLLKGSDSKIMPLNILLLFWYFSMACVNF